MKHFEAEALNKRLNEAMSIQSKNIGQAIQLAESVYQEVRAAEASDDAAVNVAIQVRASYMLGSFLRRSGASYSRAERLLLDSLSAVDPASHLRREILIQLGALYIELDALEQALTLLESALAESSIEQDPVQHAYILLSLALATRRKDPAQARSLFDSALLVFSGESNQKGIALTMLEYSTVMRDKGQFAECIETLSHAAQLFGDIGESRSRGVALQKLSEVHLLAGNLPQAHSAIQAALEIADRFQLLSLRVDALRTCAKILDHENDVEQATELRDEADALASVIGLNSVSVPSLAGIN